MAVPECYKNSLTIISNLYAGYLACRGKQGLNNRIFSRRSFGRQQGANPYSVRQLQTNDTLALILHFARLSPPDRFMRFNGRVGFYALTKRYREVDWERTRMFGVFEGKRLIAAAELAEFSSNGESCLELALSVNGNRRGRGLGGMLIRDALEMAGREGHARIVLSCRADNAAIICLARKFAGSATRSGSEIQFVYELPLNATPSGPENNGRKLPSDRFI